MEEDSNITSHPTKNVENAINYALRYTGRPVMAESRILNYDDSQNTVVWFYNPHENEEETILIKEDAKSFINKLLIHIPRPHFRMVRYYGIYSNACSELLFKL